MGCLSSPNIWLNVTYWISPLEQTPASAFVLIRLIYPTCFKYYKRPIFGVLKPESVASRAIPLSAAVVFRFAEVPGQDPSGTNLRKGVERNPLSLALGSAIVCAGVKDLQPLVLG